MSLYKVTVRCKNCNFGSKDGLNVDEITREVEIEKGMSVERTVCPYCGVAGMLKVVK